MDDPAADPAELAGALAALAATNRWLGGISCSIAGLRRALRLMETAGSESSAGAFPSPFRLLDVGCGSADFLAAAAPVLFACLPADHPIELHGIELDSTSVAAARARLAVAARAWPVCIRWHVEHVNLHDVARHVTERRASPFAIVHSALMLHHLGSDAEVVRGLAAMRQCAAGVVIANDLHRHALAEQSIWLLARTLSSNRMFQHDAPLSVRRAFKRAELRRLFEEAFYPAESLTIQWRWAFRWLAVAPVGALAAATCSEDSTPEPLEALTPA